MSAPGVAMGIPGSLWVGLQPDSGRGRDGVRLKRDPQVLCMVPSSRGAAAPAASWGAHQ
jgi:hypothetical protein